MKETRKLNDYRKDNGYDEYFIGKGIDIGCGPDPVSKDIFTNIDSVTSYDLPQGDANSSLPKTIHVPDFLKYFSDKMEIIFAGTILLNFDFNKFFQDQTRGAAVCQIEIIGRKK